MKKIKSIVLLFCFIMVLSGCAKSTTKMTINKDRSMTLEIVNLIEDNFYQENRFDLSQYNKDGMTAEKVIDNGYSGFKVTKKYNNIDNLSNSTGKEVILSDYLSDNFDDSIFFKVEKGIFKNTYTAAFKFDTTNITEDYQNIEYHNDDATTTPPDGNVNNEDNQNINDGNQIIDEANDDIDYSQLEELISQMKLEYILNLPIKSNSNNATSVSEDGKSLTWNLTLDGVTKIDYSFSLFNMTNIYIACGGALLLIVAIVVVITIIRRKKNETLIPTDVPIHTDYDPSITGATLPNGTSVGNIDSINLMPYGGNVPETNELLSETNPINEEQIIEETPNVNPTFLETNQTLNINPEITNVLDEAETKNFEIQPIPPIDDNKDNEQNKDLI